MPLFQLPDASRALAAQVGRADGVRDGVAKRREVYQVYCAGCHGAGSRGDGPQARHLDHPAEDSSDPRYQVSLADVDMKRLMVEGGVAVHDCDTMPGGASVLSPEDVANVIAYIRSSVRE